MKVQSKAPTATASFLFSRGDRKVGSSFQTLVATVMLITFLAGCSGLKTREDAPATGPSTGQPTGHRGGVAPTAGPTTPPATPPQTTAPVPNPPPPGNPPVVIPPPPPVVAAPPPARDQVKVGVILGPGGMKTFAALGVLREMNRARIPIHAIVGLEWGAVMAGLYSVQGQINDAEWKSFKLRESEMPEQGFLSSRLNPLPFSTLRDFFEGAFGNASIEKAHIDFACPTETVKGDRVGWMLHGSYKDAMARCVPYTPLYLDAGGSMAAPFAVEESAGWLRAKGANVILLVNVMGQGEIFQAKMASEQPAAHLLWNEARRELLRAKAPIVNHVINVNTTGHPITDFNGRRALMDAGQKAATDVVNKMVSQYGF